ncbi:MAG: YeiH family putative sulfate export transporter [Clostridiales bacterium]|nr:YeiH family putative sulfate export transporter [Clostridiales bacterium]
MKKLLTYIPGFLMALLVALIARYLESLLPIPLIGESVIALFIGMAINHIKKPSKMISAGLKFTSKRVLKFSIILLGASLSIGTILSVGRLSLTVMIFTLITCFGCGYFVGKWLGLDWKLSNMISAGTGICGGSAIAAMAPVIEAEDKDVAYAMSATFLFDMAMIVLFPIMGRAMGLSDMAYGLWTGTAVNDTSSVVAAGYAFSEAAGDFATMVKLTRTLSIIPTVLIFSLINTRINNKNLAKDAVSREKVKITSLFPWFILAFVGMAIINSFGIIPATVSTTMKTLSKFLMVSALAAIGMNTDFREMKKSGINPMIHGFIISVLVVIVAIVIEYFMGLV